MVRGNINKIATALVDFKLPTYFGELIQTMDQIRKNIVTASLATGRKSFCTFSWLGILVMTKTLVFQSYVSCHFKFWLKYCIRRNVSKFNAAAIN